MRNRLIWAVGLVALVVAVGAATVAISEPVEAKAAVEIEDVKAELEALAVDGLETAGSNCSICVSQGCPRPIPCGWRGSAKCMCRTCGGSYNCFGKPGWRI